MRLLDEAIQQIVLEARQLAVGVQVEVQASEPIIPPELAVLGPLRQHGISQLDHPVGLIVGEFVAEALGVDDRRAVAVGVIFEARRDIEPARPLVLDLPDQAVQRAVLERRAHPGLVDPKDEVPVLVVKALHKMPERVELFFDLVAVVVFEPLRQDEVVVPGRRNERILRVLDEYLLAQVVLGVDHARDDEAQRVDRVHDAVAGVIGHLGEVAPRIAGGRAVVVRS